MKLLGTFYDWAYQRPIVTGDFQFQTDQRVSTGFNSVNHRRLRNGSWSGGGAFLSQKAGAEYTPSNKVKVFFNDVDRVPIYEGSFVTTAPPPANLGPLPDLDGFGPELYNRGAPDKPYMDLGNAIYELKDVPSMLRQRFHFNNLKDIGNFNLAIQFGWLPLLGDVRSFVSSTQQLRKKLEQLLRDNGRPVRRRFSADKHSSDERNVLETGNEIVTDRIFPFMHANAYEESKWTLSHETTTKIWFSAQYRYWLPDRGHMTTLQYQNMLIRRLYGLKPTPQRIYKAIPWSWLVDWVGNVQDNLANLDASVAERLINDYAFVMRQHTSVNTLAVSTKFKTGHGSRTVVSASTSAGHTRKERVAASPFGFRIKTEDLSLFQLSILSSLGLGRSRL